MHRHAGSPEPEASIRSRSDPAEPATAVPAARQVEPLVLMEWSFSYGPYDGPVELLYGCRSYTAPWYTGASTEGPDWRGDFPHRKVQAIAGRHGAYFTQENIASLAGEIRRITG